jgi:hypothetical protein
MGVLVAVGLPLLAVGDPLQRIFSFGEENTCSQCRKNIDRVCSQPYRSDMLLRNDAVRLYGTFRLSGPTCRILERWTRGMFQAVAVDDGRDDAGDGDDHHVQFVAALPDPEAAPQLLLLCRTNKEVIEMADLHPELRIVQGKQIASEVRLVDKQMAAEEQEEIQAHKKGRQTRRGRRDYTAVERIVIAKRSQGGGCEEFARRLQARGVDLKETANVRAICTVHRAKGFEAGTVAITDAVYRAATSCDGDEVHVGFVGASRHRRRLFILSQQDKAIGGRPDSAGGKPGRDLLQQQRQERCEVATTSDSSRYCQLKMTRFVGGAEQQGEDSPTRPSRKQPEDRCRAQGASGLGKRTRRVEQGAPSEASAPSESKEDENPFSQYKFERARRKTE